MGGLDQRDLGADGDVAALDGAARPATAEDAAAEAAAAKAAGAEERLEDVGDRPEALEVGRVAALAQPLVAVAVIGGAAIGVGEDLVGLGGLLEALLGVGLLVDVGMQLAGEAAERLLDLGVVGAARDAEHLVVVAGHLRAAHRSS